MRVDLITLQNYIKELEQEYQELFLNYLNYLLNFKSKRNVPRSYNTIYVDLLVAINYSKTIAFNNKNINNISISKYLNAIETKGAYFSKLKIFFDFLNQLEMLDEKVKAQILSNTHFKNPIKTYKEKKFAIPQHKWIDLYNQLSGVRKFALWFLFHTGVRVGELISLETKDIMIDDTTDTYYIKIHPHSDIHFYPKTESSIRDIPLRKQEAKEIKNFLKIRSAKHLNHDYLIYNTRKNFNHKKENRFIASYDGHDTKNMRVMVEKTIEHWLDEVLYYDEIPKENFTCEHKITTKITHNKGKSYTPKCFEVFPNTPSHRHITPHLCRYSFASNIYYKGKDEGVDLLNEVSKLLGHSNSQITF